MKRNDRHKCNNCGSKKNVKFYKKVGLYLCNSCGSVRVKGIEYINTDLVGNESTEEAI